MPQDKLRIGILSGLMDALYQFFFPHYLTKQSKDFFFRVRYLIAAIQSSHYYSEWIIILYRSPLFTLICTTHKMHPGNNILLWICLHFVWLPVLLATWVHFFYCSWFRSEEWAVMMWFNNLLLKVTEPEPMWYIQIECIKVFFFLIHNIDNV